MLRIAHEGVPAMYSCFCNGSMLGNVGDGDTWLVSLLRLSLVKPRTLMFSVLARAVPVIPPLVQEYLG